MEPMVMAMCSQDRKVRSLAKKVLGSMRMGVVRARAWGGGFLLWKYQSSQPPFLPPPSLPPAAHRCQPPQSPYNSALPPCTATLDRACTQEDVCAGSRAAFKCQAACLGLCRVRLKQPQACRAGS